ncbi:unnamed protein product [Candida verbasci]|uniref:Uncharacterized protein n=1 Tax=Candida verbasci TaxID=1227364 RepID=A0A9W4XA40_9ASCO|nr:unnamed protein product [Candida verbasci]
MTEKIVGKPSSASSSNSIDIITNNLNKQSVLDSFQFQDTVFKSFTYIIILLPTLTSIIYPNSNVSYFSNNEQIGNFIIDLLTVLLISCVVRFTMEWPYNWLKKLNQTKMSLLKQETGNTQKKLLLIRKINTFEIIALISCLVTSIFSSILLIWTRNYTIIDGKRKRMVFNNVNIALLQFWSIFRIIITFTNMLQFTSLNENEVDEMLIDQNINRSWYSDLKYYFLPNTTSTLLINQLRCDHKSEVDKLKSDMKLLKKQIDKEKSTTKSKSSNDTSSFTPFPLNKSPMGSPTQLLSHFEFSDTTITNKKKSSSPKPIEQKLPFNMNLNSPLNTIMEEDDDLIVETPTSSSFNKFDSTRSIEKSLIKELNVIFKSLSKELTISDLIKNPNLVKLKVLESLNVLLTQFSQLQILKILVYEIWDNILLLDVFRHPFRSMINLIIRIPYLIVRAYFKYVLYLPVVIFFRLFFIKPINLMGFIVYNVYTILIKKETRKEMKIDNKKQTLNREKEEFRMKKFHLSPVIPKEPKITTTNNNISKFNTNPNYINRNNFKFDDYSNLDRNYSNRFNNRKNNGFKTGFYDDLYT